MGQSPRIGMTKDLATRADAVCEFVERLGYEIDKFERRIPENLTLASQHDRVGECITEMTAHLTIRLMQLNAVMQVHHDHLDKIGCTSVTFRITEIQDEISAMLDALEIYIAAEAS